MTAWAPSSMMTVTELAMAGAAKADWDAAQARREQSQKARAAKSARHELPHSPTAWAPSDMRSVVEQARDPLASSKAAELADIKAQIQQVEGYIRQAIGALPPAERKATLKYLEQAKRERAAQLFAETVAAHHDAYLARISAKGYQAERVILPNGGECKII